MQLFGYLKLFFGYLNFFFDIQNNYFVYQKLCQKGILFEISEKSYFGYQKQ